MEALIQFQLPPTDLQQKLPNGITIENCDSNSMFVKSYFREMAGIPEKQFQNSDQLLFVRDRCKSLWKKMCELENSDKHLLIYGPPGTGKSSLTWHWCLWKAQQATIKQLRIVWIHMNALDQFATYTLIESNPAQPALQQTQLENDITIQMKQNTIPLESIPFILADIMVVDDFIDSQTLIFAHLKYWLSRNPVCSKL